MDDDRKTVEEYNVTDGSEIHIRKIKEIELLVSVQGGEEKQITLKGNQKVNILKSKLELLEYDIKENDSVLNDDVRIDSIKNALKLTASKSEETN